MFKIYEIFISSFEAVRKNLILDQTFTNILNSSMQNETGIKITIILWE